MSKKRKIYFISGAILITLCLIALFTLGFYGKVFFDKENKVIYVYHEEGKTQFETELGINSFMWNCALIFKRFPSIKPGKYTIQNGMNYYEIIDLLRSGNQTPIKFRTDNVTSVFQLAGKFGKSFESDSIQFLQAVKNILPSLPEISSNTNEEIQLQSIIAYINGDTYEFLWTATPEEFLKRFINEYNAYWNTERKKNCSEKNLTPFQAAILGSIVCGEIRVMDEGPRVAGLYLNRLTQGVLLQSDPTVVFALNTNEKIQRVSSEDLKVESPYNTYKYKGLPPAPIRPVNFKYIDCVLNAEKNDFIFMVAEAGGTGRHKFSKTYSEHQQYAKEYWNYLNSKNIHR